MRPCRSATRTGGSTPRSRTRGSPTVTFGDDRFCMQPDRERDGVARGFVLRERRRHHSTREQHTGQQTGADETPRHSNPFGDRAPQRRELLGGILLPGRRGVQPRSPPFTDTQLRAAARSGGRRTATPDRVPHALRNRQLHQSTQDSHDAPRRSAAPVGSVLRAIPGTHDIYPRRSRPAGRQSAPRRAEIPCTARDFSCARGDLNPHALSDTST
jgi:hypothetical protein